MMMSGDDDDDVLTSCSLFPSNLARGLRERPIGRITSIPKVTCTAVPVRKVPVHKGTVLRTG